MNYRAIYLLVSLALLSFSAHCRNQAPAEETAQRTEVQNLFADVCKRAGEKIYRVVPNVEGLMLLKLRPTNYSPYNQNAVDPYGYDFDWGYKDKPQPYISTFLIGRNGKGNFVEREPAVTNGYRYVEAIDPIDGKRYRYTGSRKVVGRMDETAPNVQVDLRRDPNFDLNLYDFVVEKAPAPGVMPRYGVTYDDITTQEERSHWIAGSSLKIIDLEKNEVIAERIGYMVDFAQGATPGGRQPWTFARWNKGWSCPELGHQSYGARRFVEKVLLLKGTQLNIPPDMPRQAAPSR